MIMIPPHRNPHAVPRRGRARQIVGVLPHRHLPLIAALAVVAFFYLVEPGASRLSLAAAADAPLPQLDQYGGYRDLRVPGKATGYFRVEKVGPRWVFVTPEGHAFWLRAVYAIDATAGGQPGIDALKKKYGDPNYIPWWKFVAQVARRLRAWGFNATGEYSATYMLPIGAYGGREGNPEKLPFVRLINPSLYSKQWFGVKDLIHGIDPAATPSLWRGEFPDVFDPAFEKGAAAFAREQKVYPQAEALQTPWMLGTTTDDRDYLFGFGATRDRGGWHAHLGWLTAASSPSQTGNPHIWRSSTKGVTYTDTKVYSKHALRDFLREKYGTLDALNAAWTSTYTSWDSEGGWPHGSAVLDESGRSRWLGKDFYLLKDAAPQVKADLDEWVGRVAERYFSVMARAIRRVSPNHLVFSPAALSARAHSRVLEAAGRHCDVLQIEGPWDSDASYQRVYALAGKPFFIWTTFMSHQDSPLSKTKLSGWEGVNRATQSERGQAYATFIRRILNVRAADGTYPIVGIDWWAWTDKTSGGENNNFGLVSHRDNAYDGREAVVATSKDPWGYVTGGEIANYGDFLTSVIAANQSVFGALKSTSTVSRELPATRPHSAKAE